MKKTHCYLIVCLMMAISISHGETKKTETGLSINDIFPRFIATNIYGKEVDTEKLKGKVVIILIEHFSGQEEIYDTIERKKIRDFYNAHKDKGLELINIASKKGVPFFVPKSFVEERARKYCAKNKQDFPVIIDWDWSLKKLCKMNDKPLVFVLDKQGIIRYKKEGYFIIDSVLDKTIQKLLGSVK